MCVCVCVQSKVRDLEDKCRSQSEQFGLLSHELDKFRLQASKIDLGDAALLSNPSLGHLTNGLGLTGDRGKEGHSSLALHFTLLYPIKFLSFI